MGTLFQSDYRRPKITTRKRIKLIKSMRSYVIYNFNKNLYYRFHKQQSTPLILIYESQSFDCKFLTIRQMI